MTERLEKRNELKHFETPYCAVTFKEFAAASPEHAEAFKIVMEEVDRQAVENFASFRSARFPGVSFSHSMLTITPELINRLSKKGGGNESADVKVPEVKAEGKEENTSAHHQDYFLFTAFGPPPDGNAFTVQDVGIDRFVRLMPRVAAPMRRGESPPEVRVFLCGAPTGFGGSVTPEWVEMIREHGLEKYGELYAEFIEEQEKARVGEDKAPHIVLQGVSKGAIVAEKTSASLPLELQAHTQRLLDNPAGEHGTSAVRWLKGAQVALGFTGETVARVIFDDTMKSLMAKGGPFLKSLAKKKNLPEEDRAQTSLKWKAAIAELGVLVKGTSLDTENTRSFIRRGIYDPLTFNFSRLFDLWKRSDEKGPRFYGSGKSLEAPFKDKHMFFYNRFHRWRTILDFVQNSAVH